MKRLSHLLCTCLAAAVLPSACKSEVATSPPAADTKSKAPSSPPSSAQMTLDGMDTRNAGAARTDDGESPEAERLVDLIDDDSSDAFAGLGGGFEWIVR